MKDFLSIPLLVIVAFQCLAFRCEPKATDNHQASDQLDIDLSKLESNYLSLERYQADTVYIGGAYHGDRLVIKGAQQVVIVFVNCNIQSTHAEDALVFADNVTGLEMRAQELSISGGGITFWGKVHNTQLYGGNITDTHTGIRITSDHPHHNITVSGWTIQNASHEGIYLGVSKDTANDTKQIYVTNNKVANCGWDGIQVGNCQYALISENTIHDCGIKKAYGQDYGITINPGSLAYVYDNEINNCPKPIQVLDARVFFHAPSIR